MHVPLNVMDFLDRGAFVFPQRVAVTDEPGAPGGMGDLSFAGLRRRAAGLAGALATAGVGPGGRVAIVSPNCARFVVMLYGVSGYGRALVPVNFRLTPEEVRYILEHSGAEAVFVDPEYVHLVEGAGGETVVVMDGGPDDEAFFAADPAAAPEWDGDEGATASVNYTSGTTARPKGVELTHRNLWLSAAMLGWHSTVTDRDVYLQTLPTFHANGWGMPYAAVGMGARQVVIRKIDGEEILRRIEAEGVTLLCGAPAVVTAVLDAAAARSEEGRAVPGRGTVRMVVAGAPPPSAVIARVESQLGWEFIQLYGLTETSPVLTFNRAPLEYDGLGVEERAALLSHAGPPALGVRLDIDPDGEVLARSNQVFAGYWQQPEETAECQVDGWFRTGDGGDLVGADLVIRDRKKDVIITGGENVSSIEVEDVLYRHPEVAEAAVIGVPDAKWGETVKALVVLRPGATATEADVIGHCRDSMAHFKCPTSVEIRDTLPRTATGKLQKFKLREPYWAGRDRLVQ